MGNVGRVQNKLSSLVAILLPLKEEISSPPLHLGGKISTFKKDKLICSTLVSFLEIITRPSLSISPETGQLKQHGFY